jgi:hypothetical protein
MSLRKLVSTLVVTGSLVGVMLPVALHAQDSGDGSAGAGAVDAGLPVDSGLNLPGTGGSAGLGLPGAGGMPAPIEAPSGLWTPTATHPPERR